MDKKTGYYIKLMKSLIVGTAMLGLAATGCGESAPKLTAEQTTVKEAIVAIGHTNGSSFEGIDLDHLRRVAGFVIDTSGGTHPLTFLTEQTNDLKEKTDLYEAAHNLTIGIAQRFPTIRLPVFRNSDKHIDQWVTTGLEVINRPVVVVMADNQDFRSYMANRQQTSAVTLKVRRPLFAEVSLLAPGADHSSDIIGTAVEACQSALDVYTYDSLTGIKNSSVDGLSQEVVCNSLGLAMSAALNGYSYEDYINSITKARSATFPTPDGNGYAAIFVLPAAAYNSLSLRNVPDSLDKLSYFKPA